MKNILIILISSIFIFGCSNDSNTNSSESGYDKFYKLHENDEGVLTIGMPVFLFKMFVDSNEKDVKNAVNKIKDIDIFIKDKADKDFTNDLDKHISTKSYNTLMTVNEKEANIKVMVNEKDDIISELVVVINEQKENSCVILRVGGSFNKKEVEKLAEKMDIEGISKFR